MGALTRAIGVAWVAAGALALASCEEIDGTGEQLPPGATVNNPPRGGNSLDISFFGWSFGGTVECQRDQQPISISIWEGMSDPCTQTPDDGDRVVVFELSDVTPGTYLIADSCTPGPGGPPVETNFIGRGSFGFVRGQQLQTREAEEGNVTLQGINSEGVLQGAFSVRFAGETGFTSGTFRLESECLF